MHNPPLVQNVAVMGRMSWRLVRLGRLVQCPDLGSKILYVPAVVAASRELSRLHQTLANPPLQRPRADSHSPCSLAGRQKTRVSHGIDLKYRSCLVVPPWRGWNRTRHFDTGRDRSRVPSRRRDWRTNDLEVAGPAVQRRGSRDEGPEEHRSLPAGLPVRELRPCRSRLGGPDRRRARGNLLPDAVPWMQGQRTAAFDHAQHGSEARRAASPAPRRSTITPDEARGRSIEVGPCARPQRRGSSSHGRADAPV